jgi:hypothetical protein
MTLPQGPPALHPLQLAGRGSMRCGTVGASGRGSCACVSICGGARSLRPVRRKGFGDAVLRHHGSIIGRRRHARGDDLRTQRAGGRRVDKAGVARVFD